MMKTPPLLYSTAPPVAVARSGLVDLARLFHRLRADADVQWCVWCTIHVAAHPPVVSVPLPAGRVQSHALDQLVQGRACTRRFEAERKRRATVAHCQFLVVLAVTRWARQLRPGLLINHHRDVGHKLASICRHDTVTNHALRVNAHACRPTPSDATTSIVCVCAAHSLGKRAAQLDKAYASDDRGWPGGGRAALRAHAW